VHEDLEHLRGIGDDGDDLHGAVTARATERALAGWRQLSPWSSTRGGTSRAAWRTRTRSGRPVRGSGRGRAVRASLFPAGGRCPGASHPARGRVGRPRKGIGPQESRRMLPVPWQATA
jgi:hypothetical protein